MTTVYTPVNAIATKQAVLAKYSPLNGDYGYIYIYIYIVVKRNWSGLLIFTYLLDAEFSRIIDFYRNFTNLLGERRLVHGGSIVRFNVLDLYAVRIFMPETSEYDTVQIISKKFCIFSLIEDVVWYGKYLSYFYLNNISLAAQYPHLDGFSCFFLINMYKYQIFVHTGNTWKFFQYVFI